MKSTPADGTTIPRYLAQARYIHAQLETLSQADIMSLMKVSAKLADDVFSTTKKWHDIKPTPAVLTFRGDIYSGLQPQVWSKSDRDVAAEHLWILSGLYGILRPFDGVAPYRLEMGYPLVVDDRKLPKYWSEQLATQVKSEDLFVNVTAAEYLQAVLPHLAGKTVITPKFLTHNPAKGRPVFVTVHAKIARGAYASWLLRHRVSSPSDMRDFDELGYAYVPDLSTPTEPVFVAQEFTGLGLSRRLV